MSDPLADLPPRLAAVLGHLRPSEAAELLARWRERRAAACARAGLPDGRFAGVDGKACGLCFEDTDHTLAVTLGGVLAHVCRGCSDELIAAHESRSGGTPAVRVEDE